MEARRFRLAGFDLNFINAVATRDGCRHLAAVPLGDTAMQSVQPDNTNSMPLQHSQHSVGSLMLRFVGLLLVSVAVMALIWSS